MHISFYSRLNLSTPRNSFIYRTFQPFNHSPYIVHFVLVPIKAVIDLDEEGTKAAAVTVISESTGIPHYVDFHANRPFFYIISEKSTGTIFFIGQYMGKGRVSSIASPLGQDNGKAAARYYDLCGRRLSAPPAKGLYIDGTTGRKILTK